MPSKRDRKCRLCPAVIDRQNRSGLCQQCYQKERAAAAPSVRVKTDRALAEAKAKQHEAERKYEAAQREIKGLERDLRVMNALDQGADTFAIEPMSPSGKGTNEGTVIVAASDWHVETRVKPGNVSGLNEYNPDIAQARAMKFFRSSLRLTNLLQQDLTIKNMVLALLGDFITNHIHEEFVENNTMSPMDGIVFAENLVASGIKFLLEESDLTLTVPCHSGNHARTTKKIWWSNENGHSLEYLMYLHLASRFKDVDRVTFLIPEGYHSYLDVYGTTVRFHHGHAINYQGGIGGIFIPAFKAISQWNKAREAHLDVFGHFHQRKDGGNFLSNGSLIGYDSYALSIKADFEPPQQSLVLIDKKRGRTSMWPVFVN